MATIDIDFYNLLSENDKKFVDEITDLLSNKLNIQIQLGREVELNLPIYTVTVFEKVEERILPDGRPMGLPDFGSRCTWGFYYNKQFAIDALHENATDMWEYVYDYAVVEKYTPGIPAYAPTEENIWFKYDEEKGGYFEIETPEIVKGTCNFAF